MSKAFTKEDVDTENLRLDDLPQSTHPNLVTPSGLTDLHARLEARRSELAILRANSDEFDNRLAVAVAERDIRFFEGRINRAVVVDPKSHTLGIVAFGAEVDVVTENDEQQTFRIVGEDEVDPSKGLISPYSPLGAALLGTELGGTVDWRKPTGVATIEVVAIRFP